MIRIVGNVCAPTSLRVMLRMAVGYSASVSRHAPGGVGKDPTISEDESRAAMQRAMDRAASEEISMIEALEKEYASSWSKDEGATYALVPQPRVVTMALTVSRNQKAKSDAQMRHETAIKTAERRQKAS